MVYNDQDRVFRLYCSVLEPYTLQGRLDSPCKYAATINTVRRRLEIPPNQILPPVGAIVRYTIMV